MKKQPPKKLPSKIKKQNRLRKVKELQEIFPVNEDNSIINGGQCKK